MRDTLNPEGLTFEEWVCAAGLAIVDQGLVKPYTSSYTRYIERPQPEYLKGTVLLVFGTSRPPPGIPKREKVTHYPLWVRKGWKNGEDPTEYRAMGATLDSKVRKRC